MVMFFPHHLRASAETSVGVLATNFSKARFRVRSSIFGPVIVDCTTFFRIPIKSSWLKQWCPLTLYLCLLQSRAMWWKRCILGRINHLSFCWLHASHAAAYQKWQHCNAKSWSASPWDLDKYLAGKTSVSRCHSAKEHLRQWLFVKPISQYLSGGFVFQNTVSTYMLTKPFLFWVATLMVCYWECLGMYIYNLMNLNTVAILGQENQTLQTCKFKVKGAQ